MNFILCYKEYSFKFSLGAIRDFYSETKKCLWTEAINFIRIYHECRARGASHADLYVELGRALSFTEAEAALYILAKQGDSSVTREEIGDAMIRSGMTGTGDRKREPWQLVLLDVFLKIQTEIDENAVLKKK